MAFWGGAGAGGYSTGIGGQSGMGRMGRGHDGWDEEYLGKAYDAEVVRKMLPFLRPYTKQLFVAFVCMVLFSVSLYMQPFLIGLTVRAGLKGDEGQIPILLAAMATLAIVGFLAQMAQQMITAWVGTRLLLKLRTEMYDHIQGLSLSFFDDMEVGRIISRLTSDVTVMQELLTSGSLTFAADFVGLGIVVVVLVSMDWLLAVVTFAIVPPLVFVMVIWARYARRAFINVRIKLSELYGTLGENISGVRTIQSLSREDENARRFDQLNQQNRNATIWAGLLQAAIMPVIELTVAIATAAVLIVGGIMALNASGEVDVARLLGVLAAFVLYVARFFDPIRDLVLQYTMIQRAMAGGQRIFEVLESEPAIKDKEDAIELDHVEGRVDFDHVYFSYIEGIPVLEDFDLHVAPGETIALVGHTGSGKTTVTSLISRGYDVTSGAIRIDGHDVRDIKRRSLTRHMGVVLQTPYLFSGTIRENIAYGKPGASLEEIIEASKAVGAHDFIMRLGGYDTPLHQRGENISVGQRQLLSFARAVLAAPRILILDEATAYVDTQTEVIIQRALRNLLKDRTSFVIAHRLSTIREASRIVVLEKGRIMEVGTHDELLARDGIYANLYRMAYEEQQASAGVVGEDEAVARRRHADVAEAQAQSLANPATGQ